MMEEKSNAVKSNIAQEPRMLGPYRFFSTTGWDTDLDYHDIGCFALEMNKDHSVMFEIAPNYTVVRTHFFTMMATPFLLRDSCPQ